MHSFCFPQKVRKKAKSFLLSLLCFAFVLQHVPYIAYAAPTVDSNMTIVSSGSAPFVDYDGDGLVDPGEDGSPAQEDGFLGFGHYARSNDVSTFKLEYNVNGEDANNLTLKAELVEFDAAGNPTGNPAHEGVQFVQLPPGCSGNTGPDNQTLTCSIGSVLNGTTAFINAEVKTSGSVPNGTRFGIKYTVCDLDDNDDIVVETDPFFSDPITNASAPRYDLWKHGASRNTPRVLPASDPRNTTGEDQIGVVYGIRTGIVAGGGDPRGLSILGDYDENGDGVIDPGDDANGNGVIDPNVVTFTDDISGFPAGSLLYDWGAHGGCGYAGQNSLDYGAVPLGKADIWGQYRSTSDSGNYSCTQTGTNIDVTITNADWGPDEFPDTHWTGGAIAADQTWFSSGWLEIWIPIEQIELGPDGIEGTDDDGEYPTSDTLTNFDPTDTDGLSNYGSGTEPTEDDQNTGDRKNTLEFTAIGGGTGWSKYYRKGVPGEVYDDPDARYWTAPTNATGVGAGNGQAMAGSQWSTLVSLNNTSVYTNREAYMCDKIDPTTFFLSPSSQTNRMHYIRVGGSNVDQTYSNITSANVVLEVAAGVDGGAPGNWGGANTAGWTAQRNGTCDDSDALDINGDGNSDGDDWIQVPEFGDLSAVLPAGVAVDDITKFRVRIEHPDIDPNLPWKERSILPAGKYFQAYVMHEAQPGLALGTEIANQAYYSFIDKDDILRQGARNYNPETHSGVGNGDRLFATNLQVRIEKEALEAQPGSGANHLGGTDVTWNLRPTVTSISGEPGDPAQDVQIVDVLDSTLTYVTGSAMPASFIDDNGATHLVEYCVVAPCDRDDASHWTTTEPVLGSDVLGLKWVLGVVELDRTNLPTLSFVTTTPIDAANGTNIENTAIISDPEDSAIESARSDTDGIVIIQLGAFAVVKRVEDTLIFINEDITYELVFANIANDDVDWYDLIDTLPFNGDTRTTPSDFTGGFEILSITADPSNQPYALYLTNADPATITADSSDPTNAIPGGSTLWCTDDTALDPYGAPALGSPGCPTGLSDATSFRIYGENLFAGDASTVPATPGAGKQSFRVTISTDANTPGDFYANDYSVKVPPSILSLPARSNPVYTEVYTASIGDLVFIDANRNDLFDTGDTKLAGVDLELVRESDGAVIDTATTDGNGRYVFQNIAFTGDYRVRVLASNFLPGGALYTYVGSVNPSTDPNDDDNETENHDAIPTGAGDYESGILTLDIGTEPLQEEIDSIDVDNGISRNAADANDNLTVDFGFYQPPVSINIDKRVQDPDTGDFVDTIPEQAPGTELTYQMVVTNTGEVALDNVAVTDPDLPNCDLTLPDQNGANDGVLDPGQIYTYTCTGTITADVNPNTASVTGDPTDGQDPVDDDDDASAPLFDISILKEVYDPLLDQWLDVAAAEIALDDDATFRFTITNTGSTAFEQLELDDDTFPSCSQDTTALGVSGADPFEPGEVIVTTCDVAIDGAYTNVATSTGTTASGSEIDDSDDANVETFGIEIEKLIQDPATGNFVEVAEIPVGDPATYQITVRNTGTVDLTNVSVTDPTVPACNTTIASLPFDDSVTYTCTYAEVLVPFTNTAEAEGETPNGNTPDDDDDAEAQTYGVEIQKLVYDPATDTYVDYAEVPVGDTAQYQIVVTNIGSVDLTNVTVTDAQVPDCDNTFATLAAGASETYTCEMVSLGDNLVNTASVTGETPGGNNPNDDDDAEADVYGLTVDKRVQDPNTGDFVEFTEIPVGDTVTYQIIVTNTGTVDLTNVNVTDPLVPDCDNTFATITAGASETYTCTTTATDQTVVNTATATGETPNANEPEDDDDAEHQTYGIEIEKLVYDAGTDSYLDYTEIPTGEEVMFQIAVTNTGSVDLANVEVTDPNAPNCDNTFATLAAGATETYTCTLNPLDDAIVNIARATGETPEGNMPTDDDDAEAGVYGLAIEKLVQDPITGDFVEDTEIPVGDTVTYQIRVVNTGSIDLSNVEVVDPTVPACDNTFATLAAGAQEIYTCTTTATDQTVTNTVTATGETPGSNEPEDDDDAEHQTYGINIDKQVLNPVTGQFEEYTEIPDGDEVTFQIIVTNTGSVELTNVTVSDPQVPNCDTVIATLAAGASETYTCTLNPLEDALTNVADVTGETPDGNTPEDDDDAEADVYSLDIDKRVQDPDTGDFLEDVEIPVGDTVTYQIVVTNTGTVDLTNVNVVDPLVPDCDNTFAVIPVGGSETYTCTTIATDQTLTNIIAVTGMTPEDNEPEDDDDAEHQTYGVEIDKQVLDPATGEYGEMVVLPEGSAVTFQIIVRNTGSVELTDVVVSDPNAPNCDNTFASLAAGASETYTCTLESAPEDFINYARVTGETPDGHMPTDEDEAEVDTLSSSVNIVKTAGDAPDGDGYVHIGEPVIFTYTVTNTGESHLKDIVVNDDNGTPTDETDDFTVDAATCPALAGPVAPEEVVVCTVEIDVPIGLIHVNIAETTGTPTDEDGTDYENPTAPIDEDDAEVITGNGVVAGTLWIDVDGDDDFDSSEEPLANVDINIYFQTENGGEVLFTTTTDEDGNYYYDNLPYGDYRIVIDETDIPAELSQSFDVDQILDALTETTITEEDPASYDNDFAYNQFGQCAEGDEATIGNRIFEDMNCNGKYDPDIDLPLSGIEVKLKDREGNTIDRDTTSDGGKYELRTIGVGYYTVVIDDKDIEDMIISFDSGSSKNPDNRTQIHIEECGDDTTKVDFGLIKSECVLAETGVDMMCRI